MRASSLGCGDTLSSGVEDVTNKAEGMMFVRERLAT